MYLINAQNMGHVEAVKRPILVSIDLPSAVEILSCSETPNNIFDKLYRTAS
jgi:hypothetical protein